MENEVKPYIYSLSPWHKLINKLYKAKQVERVMVFLFALGPSTSLKEDIFVFVNLFHWIAQGFWQRE